MENSMESYFIYIIHSLLFYLNNLRGIYFGSSKQEKYGEWTNGKRV